MRKTVLGLAAAALLLPLVGTAAAGPGGSRPAPPPAALADLRDYPQPEVTAEEIAAGVERFAGAHPLRITGTPTQLTAVQDLRAEAEALGYQVEEETYKGVLTALTATKPGTDRAGEKLVFGAHLDSMVGTVNGAYDNGTGVRLVMELARAFADVPTHRTLVFSFYNGEEEGALGSGEQARAYQARGEKVSAYLGFDMVGVAWPVGGATTDKNCLCMWRGARDADLDAVLAEVNYDFLGFPQGRQQVSIEGTNVRNSDERSWANAGYRTLRWAGLRKAADYPQYHLPLDNIDTIVAEAGGREFFGEGMRNTLLSAYYTAAALDLEGGRARGPVAVPASGMVRNDVHSHFAGDGHTH